MSDGIAVTLTTPGFPPEMGLAVGFLVACRELLFLGRAVQGECRSGAARDRLQHLVEVARADLAR